ncbi:MAG: RelA/SpoT family protein [Christensenellales bacterium]
MEKIEQAKIILEKNCSESEIRKTNSARELLNETKLDQSSIIAASLYMPYSNQTLSKDQIVDEFGEEVFGMLHGLIELRKVQYNNEQEEAENIRKMYFALAKDFRIIFIKLAFVVAQMRNQDLYSSDELKNLAKLNLDLFAPLAARLGLSKIKSELEDCSFKILHPQKYRDIESAVENKYILAQSMIEKIKENLRQILDELEVHGEIMGRRKHAYSIYKKIINKHENIDDIYDLVALRVIVDTLPECYAVLGKVHQLFTPIRGRFKDYIATPKSNGYQSLHTTILFEGLPVEIQIRTFDMHRSAEYGYAAHWMYKEKRNKQDSLDEKLGWIRQILEENDNFTSKEMIDSLKVDIYDGEIFVQTPKGKVVHLPQGATCIDFAYEIHSEVGNHMIGAQINGKMRPITTKLNSGDVVSIITSPKCSGPSRDWLKYVKTISARHKIRQFFKKEMKEENIKTGKSMLEIACKNQNMSLAEIVDTQEFARLLARGSFAGVDELYASIGGGSTNALTVVNHFHQIKLRQQKMLEKKNRVLQENDSLEKKIEVEGADNILIKIANCCQPQEGDDIVGYISQGRGLIIHKSTCGHVKYYDENRIMSAKWRD